MEKQIETTAELAPDQTDFRALVDIEIVSIGGGELVVGVAA